MQIQVGYFRFIFYLGWWVGKFCPRNFTPFVNVGGFTLKVSVEGFHKYPQIDNSPLLFNVSVSVV